MDLSPITAALVTAAAGAVTTLVGILIPMLPRLLRGLQAYVDGADVTLVKDAVANAAQRALEHIAQGIPHEAAVQNMVEYVAKAMPKALKRLGVSKATLEVMCNGTLARLIAERG